MTGQWWPRVEGSPQLAPGRSDNCEGWGGGVKQGSYDSGGSSITARGRTYICGVGVWRWSYKCEVGVGVKQGSYDSGGSSIPVRGRRGTYICGVGVWRWSYNYGVG